MSVFPRSSACGSVVLCRCLLCRVLKPRTGGWPRCCGGATWVLHCLAAAPVATQRDVGTPSSRSVTTTPQHLVCDWSRADPKQHQPRAARCARHTTRHTTTPRHASSHRPREGEVGGEHVHFVHRLWPHRQLMGQLMSQRSAAAAAAAAVTWMSAIVCPLLYWATRSAASPAR